VPFLFQSALERLRRTADSGSADRTDASPIDQVNELTNGSGADRGCECVGYQAHDPQGTEHPNLTLNNLVHSVKFTGTIGVVGVFVPHDPGSPDKLHKEGEIAFEYGLFWFKGQSVGNSQANVKAHNRQLCNLIEQGKAKPSWIVSHELPLDRALEGYEHFDARDDGWTKVVLHPNGS
jgi:threonine dehydrogenase-like Zn-dependent dehydrogenase